MSPVSKWKELFQGWDQDTINFVRNGLPKLLVILIGTIILIRLLRLITAKVAKEEGYDLSKIREDTWEGKPAYVVGAETGDLKSKQFWVLKDMLLFVRDIEPARGNPEKVEDIRFIHYEPLAGAWIAVGVEVYSEGRKVFSEDYSDIQANVKLDPAVFDPQKFASTHWEK